MDRFRLELFIFAMLFCLTAVFVLTYGLMKKIMGPDEPENKNDEARAQRGKVIRKVPVTPPAPTTVPDDGGNAPAEEASAEEKPSGGSEGDETNGKD